MKILYIVRENFLLVLLGVFYFGSHAKAGCNPPQGTSGLTLSITGDSHVHVGAPVTYSLSGVGTVSGDYKWTYSGFTLSAGAVDTEASVQLVAPNSVSSTVGDKSISCKFTPTDAGWTGNCSADITVTVVDFTVTTPLPNSIFITSESFSFSGSAGNSSLATVLKWQYGEDFSGSGASGSQDITTAGEHALSLYIGNDYDSADISKDFGVIYVSDATSGMAFDILGQDVEVSLYDLAEKGARALRSLAHEANDDAQIELGPEEYNYNRDLINDSEADMVTEVKSTIDAVLGTDLIGKTTDEELEKVGGYIDSHVSFNPILGLSPDFKAIFEGGDVMDLTTFKLGLGVNYTLFGNVNIGISSQVEDTLSEIENLSSDDIKSEANLNWSFEW